ncbi:hypothetical protein AB6805_22265 [Chitinophaga sp. RCC_12]
MKMSPFPSSQIKNPTQANQKSNQIKLKSPPSNQNQTATPNQKKQSAKSA